MPHGGSKHQRRIGARYELRMHSDAARDDGELKRRLAEAYGVDRDGYTNPKSAFIRAIESTCR